MWRLKHTLGAVLLLALAGQALAAETRVTLRIADQKGGMRSQLEAANALSNLPYAIKWAEFPAAAPLAEALNAGAVDAGIIGDAPLLFALAQGAPVKAVAVDKSNPAGTAVLVGENSPLKGGRDLKGKRIATGKGSIGHFVALKALQQAGLTTADVQLVFLGPVDAKIALLSGSVDAWATWEPYTTQLVKTGQGHGGHNTVFTYEHLAGRQHTLRILFGYAENGGTRFHVRSRSGYQRDHRRTVRDGDFLLFAMRCAFSATAR